MSLKDLPDIRKHISDTQLDMMSKCGERFRRRYVLGEKVPPGVAMIVGQGVDKSVSANLNNKKDKGELLTEEEIKDVARDTVVSYWKGGISLTNDEVKEGVKKTGAAAVDKAVRLAETHYHQTAPIINPTHVQRRWAIEIGGFGVDLVGTIDVQEGAVRVRDTKTARKSPPKACAQESDQLTVYAMAVDILDGSPPIEVALDFMVDLKSGPTANSYYSRRTREDFDVLLRRIATHLDAVEKGVFVPARESDWWCSERWCGYHSTCPYVRKPVTIAGFNPKPNGGTE